MISRLIRTLTRTLPSVIEVLTEDLLAHLLLTNALHYGSRAHNRVAESWGLNAGNRSDIYTRSICMTKQGSLWNRISLFTLPQSVDQSRRNQTHAQMCEILLANNLCSRFHNRYAHLSTISARLSFNSAFTTAVWVVGVTKQAFELCAFYIQGHRTYLKNHT